MTPISKFSSILSEILSHYDQEYSIDLIINELISYNRRAKIESKQIIEAFNILLNEFVTFIWEKALFTLERIDVKYYNSLDEDLQNSLYTHIDFKYKEILYKVEEVQDFINWSKKIEPVYNKEILSLINSAKDKLRQKINIYVREKEIFFNEIPESSKGEAVKDRMIKKLSNEYHDLSEKYKTANTEIQLRTAIIKKLKEKTRMPDISKEKMMNLIDETRKKNGKHNYSAIGMITGRHHTTIKRIIIKLGLQNY